MKISKAFPPNYRQIKKVFNPAAGTVYTYGDTIYAPGIPFELAPDLIAHEEVHMKQQGDDPEVWWDKYLVDEKWRLDQEVEAYRVQYRYFVEHNKDRNQQTVFLKNIALDLSGPMYGDLLTFQEAWDLIKL